MNPHLIRAIKFPFSLLQEFIDDGPTLDEELRFLIDGFTSSAYSLGVLKTYSLVVLSFYRGLGLFTKLILQVV
jgi:hypothetical protein